MVLGTLDVILLGNLLTGKATIRTGEGTIRVGEKTITAAQVFNAASSFK